MLKIEFFLFKKFFKIIMIDLYFDAIIIIISLLL